jgi:hypothetical protein
VRLRDRLQGLGRRHGPRTEQSHVSAHVQIPPCASSLVLRLDLGVHVPSVVSVKSTSRTTKACVHVRRPQIRVQKLLRYA